MHLCSDLGELHGSLTLLIFSLHFSVNNRLKFGEVMDLMKKMMMLTWKFQMMIWILLIVLTEEDNVKADIV